MCVYVVRIAALARHPSTVHNTCPSAGLSLALTHTLTHTASSSSCVTFFYGNQRSTHTHTTYTLSPPSPPSPPPSRKNAAHNAHTHTKYTRALSLFLSFSRESSSPHTQTHSYSIFFVYISTSCGSHRTFALSLAHNFLARTKPQVRQASHSSSVQHQPSYGLRARVGRPTNSAKNTQT